jgi:pyochelin synthetase
MDSGTQADVGTFLIDLKALGVDVALSGRNLNLKARKGSLNADLTARISSRKSEIVEYLSARSASRQPILKVDPARDFQPFDMSEMQQAYWLGESPSFALGGVQAHAYWEFELSHVDVKRISGIFDELTARHAILRSVATGGGQLKVLETAPNSALVIDDMTELSEVDAKAMVLKRRATMIQHGPSTDAWPLFEARASVLSETTTVFHLSCSLIIIDGISVNILIDEAKRLYCEPDAKLPALELTVRDYACALSDFRSSQQWSAARDYWHGRIPDMPPAPDLMLSSPPERTTGHRMTRKTMELDDAAWVGFQSRSLRNGIFPQSAICAAYCSVLSRWSKSPDFTISILDGQRLPIHAQMNAVVGNFSGIVLTSVATSAVDTVVGLARQIQHRRALDNRHAIYPGVLVLREMNRQSGAASRAGMPFVFNSLLGAVSDGHDPYDGVLAHSALQTPQVLLDHQVLPVGKRVKLIWDYVAEVFPERMIDEMFDAFCTLVRRLAAEDAAWTEDGFGLRPPSIDAFPDLGTLIRDCPQGTLHAPVFRAMERFGETTAVVAQDRRLTFSDLRDCVAAVAACLQAAGCGLGDRVAVVMEKGWEQVVAVLAVNAVGGIYLPVDAAYPVERIGKILTRGEAGHVLVQSRVRNQQDWCGRAKVISVNDAVADMASSATLDPGPAGPEDLAYIIFTSGSTGEPKGVMIDHRGALNTVVDINERFAVGPGDRALALSSLGFDLSVYDIYGVLAAGGQIVIPADQDIKDPGRLAALVQDHGITLWNSVPALLQMLSDHLEIDGLPLPASLRLVMMSGDWIPVTLPVLLRKQSPGLKIVSLGGATEASIWSIWFPITRVDPAWKSIPYGKALKNQGMHVLDHRLAPRETWVSGEIHISGVGLAVGYWRDAERTSERFITTRDGVRLYRTGDWGRVLPNGDIEFLGRDDLQVKVQGFRIELGEIESVLLANDEVQGCVVVVADSATGGKRLVAFVILRPGVAFDAERLRKTLSDRLPGHMVPSDIRQMAELPVNANGKIDRSRLRDLANETGTADRAMVAPRDPQESTLHRLWQDLLGSPDISVHDNFFLIGGNSLLAVRMIAQIRKAFDRSVSLAQFLNCPTISGVRGMLDHQRATPASCIVPLQAGGDGQPIFLVHPVGGTVACYQPLVARFDRNSPVFGLQAPLDPIDGLDATDLKSLASHYLREMRGVQPQGPYRLGGWSLGGTLALEIATQLVEIGQTVDGVVLIDSRLPEARRSFGFKTLLERFVLDIGAPDAVRRAAGDLAADLDRAGIDGFFAATAGQVSDLADAVPYFDVFARNMNALVHHEVRKTEVRVLHLKAAHNSFSADWTILPLDQACRLPVVGKTFDCDHFQIIKEPWLTTVAAEFAIFFGSPAPQSAPAGR